MMRAANTVPEANKSFLRHHLSYVIISLGLVLACVTIWGIWKAAFPGLPPLQGQMEARVINVSSKVSGRVYRLLVEEGDLVEKEQPVAQMHLPEIEAKLSQAEFTKKAALATQSLVDEGSRPQEKLAARAEWEKATAAAELANKTYQRIAHLYRDKLVSRQRYDEVRADMLATANQAKAAKQAYDIAMIGAREQEKSVARDKSEGAAAGVDEVESLAVDRELTAPHSGQVDKIILVAGELAAAGFPIMTIVNLDDQWATFNIREDQMRGVRIGNILSATVPAVSDEKIEYKIYYISPKANYATWRSTRENSGYDMKTFEVRAKPLTKVDGLRPGMSVLVDR